MVVACRVDNPTLISMPLDTNSSLFVANSRYADATYTLVQYASTRARAQQHACILVR